MDQYLLTTIVFAPLAGAILLFLVPIFGKKIDPDGTSSRMFTLVISLLTFALSLVMFSGFDGANAGLQFENILPWIPSFGISYHLGVDGISIFLVLLTTLLVPIVVLASASVKKHIRGYLASMLVLETAMLGTLVAIDMFLFYVFWELMLAPMYFIIGIWGGERRIYAALKFVLYTVIGSLLMLIAIFYLVFAHYAQFGELSFALADLLTTSLTLKEELWMFVAFGLAFGIKIPLFPFHTWLPDAHVEAPTGGSVILAGVLLKMGLYGYIRFAYPLFPRAAEVFTPLIIALAVIGIIYGALVAWVQTDIKKLVAYSSVSHLGYCVLGFFAFNVLSTTGSIYQMLNHGISTGALFLLVGVLYDRRHTREISEYGGLAGKIPIFAFLFLVFTMSSIALPLTNGFIGEFLILLGSFQTFPLMTGLAVLGVILGAVYMLGLYMKTMFGELNAEKNGTLTDVNFREMCCFAPLLVLVFYMGIFPQGFIKTIEPTVKSYIELVEKRGNTLDDLDAEFVEPSLRSPKTMELLPASYMYSKRNMEVEI